MTVTKKNSWLVSFIGFRTGAKKIPSAKKITERMSENVSSQSRGESYLEIPTFIRQGRELSEL